MQEENILLPELLKINLEENMARSSKQVQTAIDNNVAKQNKLKAEIDKLKEEVKSLKEELKTAKAAEKDKKPAKKK